jgi:DNA-binding transcriptional LysR family regulator
MSSTTPPYQAAWSGLEMRHLLALVAVVETGTFSRAAEQLGYTQSAVSQQVGTLERMVGAPLFERPGGPRPVRLTAAGEVLLTHARAVLARVNSAATDLRALASGEQGELRVGTLPSVGTKVLPRLLGTQGPGVLSVCPAGDVGPGGVGAGTDFRIMRFSQPHDHGGSPCLPTHHPRSRRAWPRFARPARSDQLNRRTCSPTWPPSPTPGPVRGAGTHWSPSWCSPLPRSWRCAVGHRDRRVGRGRTPSSPEDRVVAGGCGSGHIAWLGCR